MSHPPDSRYRSPNEYGDDSAIGRGGNGDGRGVSGSSVPAPGLLNQGIFWTVSWVLLTGLYVLLVVDSVDVPELIMGAVAAAVGATAGTAVRAQRLVVFRPRLHWALGLWRLPLQAALDTGVLVAVLWRRLVMRRAVGGSFRAVPFRAGGEGPEAPARRAVAKGAASFAPNTYILDIDPERELVLVHQLVPKPDQPKKIDPLGLG